jgi:hypothetical protein
VLACQESNLLPEAIVAKDRPETGAAQSAVAAVSCNCVCVCVCVQASPDLRDLLALRYNERILASKASLGCSQYID